MSPDEPGSCKETYSKENVFLGRDLSLPGSLIRLQSSQAEKQIFKEHLEIRIRGAIDHPIAPPGLSPHDVERHRFSMQSIGSPRWKIKDSSAQFSIADDAIVRGEDFIRLTYLASWYDNKSQRRGGT